MNMQILGTGSELPKYILTNDELTTIVDTSDEWIKERTGIGRRHISKGETVASLAAEACKNTPPRCLSVFRFSC